MTSHRKCYFLDIIILTQFGVVNAFTQFSKAYIYDGVDVAANTLRSSKSSRVESCLLSCAKDTECRSLVFEASSQECIFGSLNFPGTYQRMTATQMESYQKAVHNCDDGWTEFQGSCYFMTRRTPYLGYAD
ncbi:hypothetical protein MAR_026686, partial [Mya arenaria]